MMIRSLNYAVTEVLQQGVSFWIASAMRPMLAPSRPQPKESPRRRWVRIIGTCSITFSVWRKEFARARSTTINGAGTRKWKDRSRVHVSSPKTWSMNLEAFPPKFFNASVL